MCVHFLICIFILATYIYIYYAIIFLTDEPVSSFVSTSHDETALLWHWNQETNAVDCINVCKGHARSVDCVAVSPATDRVSSRLIL